MLKVTPNSDVALTDSSHNKVYLQQNFVKPETGFYFPLRPFKAIKIKKNLTKNLLCWPESLGTLKLQKPEGSPASPRLLSGFLPNFNGILTILTLR